MEQQTPGPWEQFPPGTIISNPTQCVIKRREDSDWIASVQISNIPNWEANAHLIAAAPDLLKALERIDALLNNSEIYNHAWTNAPEKPEIAPRDIAKAAIAKAKP